MQKNRRLRARRKTMLAGILILLGVMAFAYQGIASITDIKTIDVRPTGPAKPQAPDAPSLPLVGGIAIFGGVGLLILESTRPAHPVHHRHAEESQTAVAAASSATPPRAYRLRHWDLQTLGMTAGSRGQR